MNNKNMFNVIKIAIIHLDFACTMSFHPLNNTDKCPKLAAMCPKLNDCVRNWPISLSQLHHIIINSLLETGGSNLVSSES